MCLKFIFKSFVLMFGVSLMTVPVHGDIVGFFEGFDGGDAAPTIVNSSGDHDISSNVGNIIASKAGASNVLFKSGTGTISIGLTKSRGFAAIFDLNEAPVPAAGNFTFDVEVSEIDPTATQAGARVFLVSGLDAATGGTATIDLHGGEDVAITPGKEFFPNVDNGASFTQVGADTLFVDGTGAPATGTYSASFTLPAVKPGDFLVAQVFRAGAGDGSVVIDSIAINPEAVAASQTK